MNICTYMSICGYEKDAAVWIFDAVDITELMLSSCVTFGRLPDSGLLKRFSQE